MGAEFRANYVTPFYKDFAPVLADGIWVLKMARVDDAWPVHGQRFLGEGEGSG